MARARAISKALAAGQRQRFGTPIEIAPQSDLVQNHARSVFSCAARTFARVTIHGGHDKIVDDAQAAEGAHDLERARDA